MKFTVFVFILSVFLMLHNVIPVEGFETHVTIPETAQYESCTKHDNCLLPSELTVCVGSQVSWISDNYGSISLQSGQVIKEKDSLRAIGTEDFVADHIPSDQAFTHKFQQSGVYEYFLVPYLHAQGKIIVTDDCNLPPLQQLKTGIDPLDVQCKKGLELVIKSSDGFPACVKPETAEKLIERGWASP